jgi:hypothetical protein
MQGGQRTLIRFSRQRSHAATVFLRVAVWFAIGWFSYEFAGADMMQGIGVLPADQQQQMRIGLR